METVTLRLLKPGPSQTTSSDFIVLYRPFDWLDLKMLESLIVSVLPSDWFSLSGGTGFSERAVIRKRQNGEWVRSYFCTLQYLAVRSFMFCIVLNMGF